MERTDDFRELSLLYFEGKISRADESRLYAYIKENAENRALFRRWEQEWLAGEKDNKALDENWQALQQKLKVAGGHSREKKLRLVHRPVFRYLAAAVVLACVAVISFKLAVYSFEPDTEKLFVFETPNGERSKLTLGDGTVVWLNSGSRLCYSNRFDVKERRVEVSGEAYFDVAKQDGREFTVDMGSCNIVVKGTKFNVSAYPEDDYVQATLLEGSIEFRRDDRALEVAPGEQVRMEKASGEWCKEQVDAGQSNAWVDGRIEYDHITLRDLLPKLARHYDVVFHLETDSLAERNLRILVRNEETVHDVLKALSEVIPMTVTVEGRDIYIR